MKLFEPESDISLNVVVVAGDIFNSFIKEKKPISIPKLMKIFLNQDIRRTHNLFFDALTFLFILNVIKVKNFQVVLIKLGHTQKNLFGKRII